MVTCNSICTTVWRDIFLISSALAPEDNWMEAAHTWLFVVKSVGRMGGRIVLAKLSLIRLPSAWISYGEVKTLLSHT